MNTQTAEFRRFREETEARIKALEDQVRDLIEAATASTATQSSTKSKTG